MLYNNLKVLRGIWWKEAGEMYYMPSFTPTHVHRLLSQYCHPLLYTDQTWVALLESSLGVVDASLMTKKVTKNYS